MQKGKNWPLILIMIVLAVFGIDVIGESIYDISAKYGVDDQ